MLQQKNEINTATQEYEEYVSENGTHGTDAHSGQIYSPLSLEWAKCQGLQRKKDGKWDPLKENRDNRRTSNSKKKHEQ